MKRCPQPENKITPLYNKKYYGVVIEFFVLRPFFKVCKYFDIQFSLSMGQFNFYSVIYKYNITFFRYGSKM